MTSRGVGIGGQDYLVPRHDEEQARLVSRPDFHIALHYKPVTMPPRRAAAAAARALRVRSSSSSSASVIEISDAESEFAPSVADDGDDDLDVGPSSPSPSPPSETGESEPERRGTKRKRAAPRIKASGKANGRGKAPTADIEDCVPRPHGREYHAVDAVAAEQDKLLDWFEGVR